jgi:phosphatidylglycerophosphatase A
MPHFDSGKIQVWIAEGLGVGWLPFAPGTFGAALGVGWCLLLLVPGSLIVFFGGAAVTVAASVWLCGVAEKALGKSDPGSVVLDEICAMPLCYASWIIMLWHRTGVLPAPMELFRDGRWLITLGIYGAFRFFDIAKPWPVYQSQALPGGWGITADDVLAAVQVNLLFLLAAWLFKF